MNDSDRTNDDALTARRRWMGLLARAPEGAVARFCETLDPLPRYTILRGPEAGLVMLRGRAGATGQPFNAGEMTVTRCTVRLEDGTEGHAYVAGRDTAHSEAAALCDALLQDDSRADAVRTGLIEPLAERESERRRATVEKAAATKVDFFTLVRGESQ